MAADVLVLLFAALYAHTVTFGTLLPATDAWWWLPANAALAILVFWCAGLYRMPLRTAGMGEALRVVASLCGLAFCNLAFLMACRTRLLTYRISVPFVLLYLLILLDGVMLSRFFIRLYRALAFRLGTKGEFTRVMVVGAGSAGSLIIREMQSTDKIRFLPVCVIDDDKAKHRTRLHGVPVVGGRDAIPVMAKYYRVKRIFVAMPAAPAAQVRDICAICAETGCHVQILPGVYQLLSGSVMMSRIRDVEINDLLGREPIRINNEEVLDFIRGRTVLVTGGGGSIGSELCRQIAGHAPARLVIFDIYENNAYEIEQELRRAHPQLDLRVLIGSVRDAARVRAVFAEHSPNIVFHAAAHKHVPLMEHSPNEAIKNNVFGTWNVASAAADTGADRFVLISTDKAVNPTNVMGASKRICEMIVQDFARRSAHTEFVAVRFGNVLGSNGSVIPLFKKQIAAGGPVTVTHPDIIRYFMTIPEAVSLVLQAGALARGGEIFVLDMGDPVKILTLAENLIRLSGYRPYEEIDITFTGLRPGEKLYEELLMDEEGLQSTENRMIYIGQPIPTDHGELKAALDALQDAMAKDNEDIRPLIRRLVPTYRYSGAE